MKKLFIALLILTGFQNCTKDHCVVIADANAQTLCTKCFSTHDEMINWEASTASLTQQQKCQ